MRDTKVREMLRVAPPLSYSGCAPRDATQCEHLHVYPANIVLETALVKDLCCKVLRHDFRVQCRSSSPGSARLLQTVYYVVPAMRICTLVEGFDCTTLKLPGLRSCFSAYVGPIEFVSSDIQVGMVLIRRRRSTIQILGSPLNFERVTCDEIWTYSLRRHYCIKAALPMLCAFESLASLARSLDGFKFVFKWNMLTVRSHDSCVSGTKDRSHCRRLALESASPAQLADPIIYIVLSKM